MNFDVYENGDSYLFVADLPGVTQEQLDIALENDTLSITGGKHKRSFALPALADGDAAKAELKNGVLTLTLPKAKAARARKIEITA